LAGGRGAFAPAAADGREGLFLHRQRATAPKSFGWGRGHGGGTPGKRKINACRAWAWRGGDAGVSRGRWVGEAPHPGGAMGLGGRWGKAGKGMKEGRRWT